MLERMKDVLRNRKEGDKGFSLVELAVVIVIIGILVAIAVPVFTSMQTAAEKANIQAAAANGSAMVAADIAAGASTIGSGLSGLEKDSVTTVQLTTGSGTDIDDFCVEAIGSAGTAQKGPGCSGAEWTDA